MWQQNVLFFETITELLEVFDAWKSEVRLDAPPSREETWSMKLGILMEKVYIYIYIEVV